MRSGFTLIELLAVIVILAVISLISVFFMLNIIDSAKMGALKDSVYGVTSSAEYYYSGSLTETIETSEFICNNSGCINSSNVSLNYKGKIDEGRVKVFGDGSISVCIQNGDYAALKLVNSADVILEKGTCDYSLETYEIIDDVTATQLAEANDRIAELESIVDEYNLFKSDLITSLRNSKYGFTSSTTNQEIITKFETTYPDLVYLYNAGAYSSLLTGFAVHYKGAGATLSNTASGYNISVAIYSTTPNQMAILRANNMIDFSGYKKLNITFVASAITGTYFRGVLSTSSGTGSNAWSQTTGAGGFYTDVTRSFAPASITGLEQKITLDLTNYQNTYYFMIEYQGNYNSNAAVSIKSITLER